MMKATLAALVLLALLTGCVVMNPAAPVAPVVAEPTAALEPAALGMGSRAVGMFNDNTYFQHDVEIGGDATVGGALTVTGAITGGSFSPATFSSATDLIADTGQFTTSVKIAATEVARLTGSNINAASLKVATTPVALLSGSAIDATSLKVGATAVALQAGSNIDAASLKVAATPVVVQVGALAAGARIVCGSTTITGTGTLPTTLATPQYVNLTLAEDVTGNCQSLSYTNASATVTAKCFSSALTPAPATTPVAVNWCAIGK
jgi:hypothetical protein